MLFHIMAVMRSAIFVPGRYRHQQNHQDSKVLLLRQEPIYPAPGKGLRQFDAQEGQQQGGLVQDPAELTADPGLAKPAMPAAVGQHRAADPAVVIMRIMAGGSLDRRIPPCLETAIPLAAALAQPRLANPAIKPAPKHDRSALAFASVIAVVGVGIVHDRVPPFVKPRIECRTSLTQGGILEVALQMPPGYGQAAALGVTVTVIGIRSFVF